MKSRYKKRYWQILVITGLLTFALGLLSHKHMTGISTNISMLNGMIQGAGAAVAAIGALKLFQYKTSSAEKLKAKEIELNDERNIQITRISLAVSSSVGIVLLAVFSFVFIAMNYIVPGLILVILIYLQLFAMFIAYRYYDKKM